MKELQKHHKKQRKLLTKRQRSPALNGIICLLSLVSCLLLNCHPQSSHIIPSKSQEALSHLPAFTRVKHPDQLRFSEIKFTIPKPERIELGNGLIIYLLEDHELPLVEIIVRVRTGSVYDPPHKSGLANLTTRLMRTGGAGSMTAEALDEKLESLGAVLNVTTDYEEVNFSLSLLANDIEKGLETLGLVLSKPLFAEERLRFEKNQLAEVFRRENDRPRAIAMREFRNIIYPQHPYGRRVIGHPASVQGLTREDVVDLYTRYFTPQNIWLGIVGDFQTKNTLALIRKNFGDWSGPKPQFPSRLPARQALPPLERSYRKSVNLVSKEINQASILLGHIGVKRLTPDYFPLVLMNAILGRGSMSRLYHKVREERGLTYGIWSYFIMPQDIGMFVIQTETKNQSVAKALSLILEEVKRIREAPIKDEELKHTKEAIFNAFVFRFDNPQRIVNQYIYIEYMGLPRDYLETYQDKVKKVTKEDILRVARKYLHPDDIVFMVVGNEKHFDRPLTEFGPVNVIKLKETK